MAVRQHRHQHAFAPAASPTLCTGGCRPRPAVVLAAMLMVPANAGPPRYEPGAELLNERWALVPLHDCRGTAESKDPARTGALHECARVCEEFGDSCQGFVRVRPGTDSNNGGKCFFRSGAMQPPVPNPWGDTRDCALRRTLADGSELAFPRAMTATTTTRTKLGPTEPCTAESALLPPWLQGLRSSTVICPGVATFVDYARQRSLSMPSAVRWAAGLRAPAESEAAGLDATQAQVLWQGAPVLPEGSKQFVLFSTEQARECLRGRTVHFAGDSYTAMVYMGLLDILTGTSAELGGDEGFKARLRTIGGSLGKLEGLGLGGIKMVCSYHYSAPGLQGSRGAGRACYGGQGFMRCGRCLADSRIDKHQDPLPIADALLVGLLEHEAEKADPGGAENSFCGPASWDSGDHSPDLLRRIGDEVTAMLTAIRNGPRGSPAITWIQPPSCEGAYIRKELIDTPGYTDGGLDVFAAGGAFNRSASSRTAQLARELAARMAELRVPVLDAFNLTRFCAWENCTQDPQHHKPRWFGRVKGQMVLNMLCSIQQ